MRNQLRVAPAAEYLGLSKGTLRQYADEGIIPCTVLPSGHRYFNMEDLDAFLQNESKKQSNKNTKKSAYLYARVSTKKQADSGNLDRQIARLLDFSLEHGYEIAGVFKEIASGINENRRELNKLLTELQTHPHSVLIIEYKDRLARFGYNYLERYISDFGCSIEVIEETSKDDEKELVEDLMAITTSFSARIYGKRGGKKAIEKIRNVIETVEKEE
jgi:putative resolvase